TPVGPHTQAMYQLAFPPSLLASFLPWLMLNREGLSILLHPGTGDLRRSYRPRRLVGQRAAATGERPAKVAEDGPVTTCYFVDDENSPFSLHRQLLPESLCRRAFQPPCAPRWIELGGKITRACHRVRGKQCWFALTVRVESSRETRPCCQGRRAIPATMRCRRSRIS